MYPTYNPNNPYIANAVKCYVDIDPKILTKTKELKIQLQKRIISMRLVEEIIRDGIRFINDYKDPKHIEDGFEGAKQSIFEKYPNTVKKLENTITTISANINSIKEHLQIKFPNIQPIKILHEKYAIDRVKKAIAPVIPTGYRYNNKIAKKINNLVVENGLLIEKIICNIVSVNSLLNTIIQISNEKELINLNQLLLACYKECVLIPEAIQRGAKIIKHFKSVVSLLIRARRYEKIELCLLLAKFSDIIAKCKKFKDKPYCIKKKMCLITADTIMAKYKRAVNCVYPLIRKEPLLFSKAHTQIRTVLLPPFPREVIHKDLLEELKLI